MKLSRKSKPAQDIQTPGHAATPSPTNHLSNVIEIGKSDASVGDSKFNLPFLTGLFNHGMQRAIDAGITSLTEGFLAHLSEHAHSIAREQSRAVFDPKSHLHDQMQYAEYERALQMRSDAIIGEDHSVARRRAAKSALDATKRVGDKPKRPAILLVVSVAMMAVSLTATIHDRLMPAGMDPVLSIVLCIIIGAFLAASPVYAIYHGRNSVKRWIGLVIGLLLAGGLFAVRAAGSDGGSELLYSAGWSLIELVGVLIAEYFSQAHRKAEVEWSSDHDKEVAAEAAVASADDDVALWRGRIDSAQRELDRVSALVDERNSRALRSKDIEELCVKAVRDGAHSGAAHNLSIVRGLKAPHSPKLDTPASKEAK